MNITKRQASQLVGYGVGGSVVAVAYHLANIYAQQKVPIQLQTDVECVYSDRQLTVLLQQAEQICRRWDEVALIKLIDSLDRLVHMYQLSMDTGQKKTYRDLVFAHDQFKRAQKYLQRMINTVESDRRAEAADVLNVHKLCKSIAQSNEKYFRAITNNMREVAAPFIDPQPSAVGDTDPTD